MTRPAKMVETPKFRIVRVRAGFTVLEVKDGHDWLGAARWHCGEMIARRSGHLVRATLGGHDGLWWHDEFVREVLWQLGDELMRLRRLKRRRK